MDRDIIGSAWDVVCSALSGTFSLLLISIC